MMSFSILLVQMPLRAASFVVLGFGLVMSAGCGRAGNTANNKAQTPANAAIAAKPTEAEVKPTDAKPVGREIKAADGPALKSITPVEGTVLGGVLNDLAISLPKPEIPADAKGAKGKVTVEVVVNEKGLVSTSSVVDGPTALWSAAAAAARAAKFDPPLKDGKPVKVAGVLTFVFE